MQISSINYFNLVNYNKPYYQPTFEAGGKPIGLQYVLEKRSNLLPERVLAKAKEALKASSTTVPSLMELHLSIYAPLLTCKTLAEAQEIFPEFSAMTQEVKFERNSRYAKEFYSRTDESFALKMLQKFWAELKTKDDIAQEFGMLNRNSLEWPLKQIGFVSFKPNYKTLLLASDEKGNQEIASKTTAWNALHPDLMYAKNKHAAQGCKTKEYREAQSQRMKDYDKEHPERREKISVSGKEAWAKCPEVRKAMSDFAAKENSYVRSVMKKRFTGQPMSDKDVRISKGFFKRFWQAHPELKAVYAESKKIKTKS